MERFKSHVVDAYNGLDLHLQHTFTTIISAINANLLDVEGDIYEDVDILVDTGVPKFTKFTVNFTGDWYNNLTKTIARRMQKNAVDVIHKGLPIILIPTEELHDLVDIGTRFQIKESDVVIDIPSSSLPERVHTPVVRTDANTLVGTLRDSFMAFLQTHPEAEENMLPLMNLLKDGKYALNFISEWITATAMLPERSLNVVAEILKAVDPTPVITPIITEFSQAVRAAAGTTSSRMSGSPKTSVVMKAFGEYFNLDKVVNVVHVAQNGIPMELQAKRSQQRQAHQPQYSTVHSKKALFQYNRSQFDAITIGDAYSLDLKARERALTPNIGDRLFLYDAATQNRKLLHKNPKLHSSDFISVEISPMLPEHTRRLKKLTNKVTGAMNKVLIGLFAVNGRNHTMYTHCYALQLSSRNEDTPEFKWDMHLPAIINQRRYRVVIWDQRKSITGKEVWGSRIGRSGTIPPFSRAFDIIIDAPNAIYSFENHPHMNVEHELLNKINDLKYEQVANLYDKIIATYYNEMNPEETKAARISSSQEANIPIQSTISDDVNVSFAAAVQFIKDVRSYEDEITDAQDLYLRRVLEAILVPGSPTHLPIYTGPLHDDSGRNRESLDFINSPTNPLNTFGTTYFGIENSGIHIFGRHRIHVAFTNFLLTPQSTIVAAIKTRYPHFDIKEDDVVVRPPSMAMYTGDWTPVDDPEEGMRGNIKYDVLGCMMDASSVVSQVATAVGTIEHAVVDSAETVARTIEKDVEELALGVAKAVFKSGKAVVEDLVDLSEDVVHDVTKTTTEATEALLPPPSPQPQPATSFTQSKISRPSISTKVIQRSTQIGSSLAAGGVKTKSGVTEIDMFDEYHSLQVFLRKTNDDDNEELESKFLKILQIALSYQKHVKFFVIRSVYRNFIELSNKDDNNLKFVNNSDHQIAYMPNRLFLIIGRSETHIEDLWPRISDIPEVFEMGCELASGEHIDLILYESMMLHISGEDTNFRTNIGSPLAHLTIQYPDNSVQTVKIPSLSSTINDVGTMTGKTFDTLQVVVGGKHRGCHDKVYKVGSSEAIPLKTIYDSLPDEYKVTGSIVLRPYTPDPVTSHERGMKALKQIIPWLPKSKLGYVFTNPTDYDIDIKFKGKPLTARKFSKRFIHAILKDTSDDGFKLDNFKSSHLISKDFSTITIGIDKFLLQKKSSQPLIYIIGNKVE